MGLTSERYKKTSETFCNNDKVVLGEFALRELLIVNGTQRHLTQQWVFYYNTQIPVVSERKYWVT